MFSWIAVLILCGSIFLKNARIICHKVHYIGMAFLAVKTGSRLMLEYIDTLLKLPLWPCIWLLTNSCDVIWKLYDVISLWNKSFSGPPVVQIQCMVGISSQNSTHLWIALVPVMDRSMALSRHTTEYGRAPLPCLRWLSLLLSPLPASWPQLGHARHPQISTLLRYPFGIPPLPCSAEV